MTYYTSVLNHENLPFAVSFTDKVVTACSLAPFIANFYQKTDLFKNFCRQVSLVTGRTANPFTIYKDKDLLLQRLLGLTFQFPALNDALAMKCDAAFMESLGKIASPATLCRQENSIALFCKVERNRRHPGVDVHKLKKHDLRRIGSEIFDNFNRLLLENALKSFSRKQPYFILDADSTFIEVAGQQENSAYCAKNGANGFFPLMLFLNGVPVHIQNAPGATHGTKLLEQCITPILEKITELFPATPILVRADGGFNGEHVIEQIENFATCRYLIGYTVNGRLENNFRKQLSAQYKVRCKDPIGPLEYTLPQAFINEIFADYCLTPPSAPKGKETHRWCGKVSGYQAASWKNHRELYYRIQYSEDHNEIDMRAIQTNLTEDEIDLWARHLGVRKGKTDPDACFDKPSLAAKAIDLYDGLYCDRAHCEQQIRSFKEFGTTTNLSAHEYFTNWFRLILGAVAMHLFTELKEKAFKDQHRSWLKKSFKTLQRDLFRLPGIIRKLKNRVVIELTQPHPDVANAFIRLIQVCG